MQDRSTPRALLVTGAMGVGKTSVIEELAELLEDLGFAYAAIDLDWIGWFGAPGRTDDEGPGHRVTDVLLRNLAAVVHNYLDAGVTRFLLARSMREREEVEDMAAVLGMPLTIVRLTLPFEEIERRLGAAVTSGRAEDLAQAKRWLAGAHGEGFEDAVVANDRSIAVVAGEILELLGWN
jgi:adenylylsulfate kinase